MVMLGLMCLEGQMSPPLKTTRDGRKLREDYKSYVSNGRLHVTYCYI